MAEEDEAAEKSHEPSQRKLEQQRKKGEIPRSVDINTAMAYLGLLVCGVAAGKTSLTGLAEGILPLLAQPDRLISDFFEGGATAISGSVIIAALTPALPLLIAPGIFVLLTLFAMRGFTFSTSKLKPKISRIDPIANAKSKFGRKGLFDFFKSFIKLVIYSVLLGVFLSWQLDDIAGMIFSTPAQITAILSNLILRFLAVVVGVAFVIGVLDAFFQHSEHLRKNRMTLKELRDEMKDSEGDPHMKQHRRARAQEIAMSQMISEVPKANVIIVNPTHYAVALKWDRLSGGAPVCIAKGTDHIAARIREAAAESGVPVHSDPPTARALFASVDIGHEISKDLYRPVAAAIRFADSMRAKAREKGW